MENIGWSASSTSLYVFDWYKAMGPQIYQLNIDPNIPAKTISTSDGFIQPLTLAFNAKRNYFAFGYEKNHQLPQIVRTPTQPFQLEHLSHFSVNLPEKLGSAETS